MNIVYYYIFLFYIYTSNAEYDCNYNSKLSTSIASLLCAVESGILSLDPESDAILNAGCLLGGGRCSKVMHVPTEDEIPESKPPPPAKNKQYQHLATIAESFVEKTWWRKGFSSDLLLLSHNDSELPRKQFSPAQIKNKRLKNMFQCISRQQFIRKSYDFNNQPDPSTFTREESRFPNCNAMERIEVREFHKLWELNRMNNFGGEFKDIKGRKIWQPVFNDNNMLGAATKVLELFYADYGGIWTGCFKFDRYPDCRGALAAASLVTAMSILTDLTGSDRKTFKEGTLIRGYFMASMGRSVLHGHDQNVGDEEVTVWKVKPIDLTALQAAFLRLYMDSFGRVYNTQLNTHIPVAFTPSFKVHSKQEWAHLATNFEPVYTSLRNWMFTEASNLIDFGPYKPLIAEPEARKAIAKKSRRVLIDVGANGFFASPKYLLDSYSLYLPFTHAIMIEPEPHFSATIPKVYSDTFNISFLKIYAEVGTESPTDILKLLPTLVTQDDFVVLKFDVDPNRYAQGPTMEWGFLFQLMKTPQIAKLIDELYIELHFHFPSLYWSHYHSNWEALDAFRYLRSQGAIVHSWP